jgi:hypothetical protein
MHGTPKRRYPKDNLGRRIRGRRTPSGKRLVLQPRDIEIFKLLRRYRFLRSTYIWSLLPPEHRGKSFKRFQDRLTGLFHETDTPHGGAYLDWPQQQRETYNARYTASIYALSAAGEALLGDENVQVNNLTDLVRSGRTAVNREFAHTMMICDTLASIELGVQAEPNVRLVSWQEILAKAPKETQRAENPFAIPVEISHRFPNATARSMERFRLIPDGLFGLEYALPTGKKVYRFFALEAERRNRVNTGSLKGASFLKKVLAYRTIIENEIHTSYFGIPNLLILTVTPRQARIDTMKKMIAELYPNGDNSNFLFRCVSTQGYDDQVKPPTSHMFHEPWQRVGSDDFRLNDQQAR